MNIFCRQKLNEMNDYFDKRISRIIELELILTQSIYKGHKPKEDDEFKEVRKELELLRTELNIKRKIGK